jgi:alpha-mannosidase
MQLLQGSLDSAKAGYRATLAQWLARLEPSATRIRRDTIDLVGHSHIDAAWLWRWRDGRDEVQHTWETTTKLMAKYPDMHFAASSAQYYAWLEETDPEALMRIRTLAKEGRWDPVGGWWVESDANIPSGESLVRQALYGQHTYMRLFGKPARVAWLPNTFGFAWSLPQILRKSGFEFFVTEEMRWNDTNRWPPGLNAFWWEGPDGSRIFTDMVYAYDHDLSPPRLAKEFVVTRDSSASPRMMTVYGVGDHGGGPTMAMLDRARDLERVPTFPVVRDASPDSSLSRMRRDALSGPVLRDELYLEYHRGTYTTQAAMKRRNRALESLLGAAEAAAALAPAPYPRDSLRTAWERVLFNQFHDILPGTSAAEVYGDANVDYERAESIALRVLGESLTALAARLDTRPASPGEISYVVFNSTGRRRTGVVRLPLAAGSSARDARGRVLASAIEDSSLAIRVPNVPALGVSLIFVRHAAEANADTGAPATASGVRVLENASLRVEIDPKTGNIMRLYDRAHHREALAPGAASLILFEDQPKLWDAWNIDNLAGKRSPIDQSVHVDAVRRTPLGDELTVHRARDSAQVTEQYTLRESPDRLDIAMSIDWHETQRLLKLALPLAFHVDSTRAEIPYASIARPTRPLTRRDSARFEVPMQRWLDASARSFGVAVANDGKYGYSASGDTMFITLLRSPKSPDPHADMGMQTTTVSIVPHAGDWRAPEIREAATELNSPMLALPVPAHAGSARASSWLAVEPSTVAVGALKRGEDDEREILRLVETTGRATTAQLHFAAPVDAAEVDLLERALPAGYRGAGSQLEVPLGPFEIKTLAIGHPR